MKTLPTSYKDLPWQKYVAIINKIPSEKPEQLTQTDWSRLVHMATLTILLEASEGEIEALPASEVLAMIKTISFMDVVMQPEKTAYRVKDINELTYDEFVTYQDLRAEQWSNLEEILLIVLKDATSEQIATMSIYDVMQVFFCLKKSTSRFLTRLKYSTLLSLIVQILKALPRRLKGVLSKSSKSVGDGLN